MPLTITVSANQARIRPVVARLSVGATEAAALAELKSIVGPISADFGGETHLVPEILPIPFLIVGDIQRSLYIFAGAVAFVLLIACANVANLLLMRATTRRHEMAVRIALGADRTRLVRQLLTESILLSCLGGAIGIALAVAGVRALVAMAPAGLLPRTNEVHVDGFVLAFTATLCVLTGICFGLVPALQTSKRNLSASIGEGSGHPPPCCVGLVTAGCTRARSPRRRRVGRTGLRICAPGGFRPERPVDDGRSIANQVCHAVNARIPDVPSHVSRTSPGSRRPPPSTGVRSAVR